MQSVEQTCGNPASQSTYVKPTYLSQEWIYYVNTGFNQGTSELKVVFNNGQIVNLTITGNTKVCEPTYQTGFLSSQSQSDQQQKCNAVVTQRSRSVSSTTACGALISLGDTVDTVQSACGQPVFANHGQVPDSQKTVTVFQYDGSPPTKLIFEDGVLTDRVQGG